MPLEREHTVNKVLLLRRAVRRHLHGLGGVGVGGHDMSICTCVVYSALDI